MLCSKIDPYNKLELIMSISMFLRAIVLLHLVLAAYTATWAQESAALSVHRLCSQGSVGEKIHLRYWYPEVSNDLPEPVCLISAPEFSREAFRSVQIEANQTQSGATVVIEYDQSAKLLIEKMSRENLRKPIAIVVANKILSIPMVTQPYSDIKLFIATPSRSDAERIVAVLKGNSKRSGGQ